MLSTTMIECGLMGPTTAMKKVGDVMVSKGEDVPLHHSS